MGEQDFNGDRKDRSKNGKNKRAKYEDEDDDDQWVRNSIGNSNNSHIE